MPTYEYRCDECGEFSAIRPIRMRDTPCICPQCGTASPRVLVAAPSLAVMSSGARNAHSRNERAANAPMTSSEYRASHRHGPGCGCCGGSPSKTTVTAHTGEKAFPTKRPWMISH